MAEIVGLAGMNGHEGHRGQAPLEGYTGGDGSPPASGKAHTQLGAQRSCQNVKVGNNDSEMSSSNFSPCTQICDGQLEDAGRFSEPGIDDSECMTAPVGQLELEGVGQAKGGMEASGREAGRVGGHEGSIPLVDANGAVGGALVENEAFEDTRGPKIGSARILLGRKYDLEL